MKLRLTSRILLTLGLLTTVPLAIVGVLSYRSGSESLKEAAISNMLGKAIEKEAGLDMWIEERLDDIRQLAGHVSVAEKADNLITAAAGSEAARSAYALLLQELKPYVTATGSSITELFVMEPESGRVVISTSRAEEGKSKVGHPYFDNSKTDLYLQGPYSPDDIRAAMITVGTPLRTNDGRVVAVLAVRLDIASLGAVTIRRTGLHKSEDAFLINAERYPVTQPRFINEPVVLHRKIDSEAVRLCAERRSGVILAEDYRGVPAIAVYRWNVKRQLGLIVKIDQNEALAPAYALGRTVVLISGIALLFTAGFAFLLARTVTRPLRTLIDGVGRFSGGEFNEPLTESSDDEIGLLARAFNQMALRVAKRTTELAKANGALQAEINERKAGESARDRLALILESTPDMVGITDPDGHILYANAAARALVGVDEDITTTVITEFIHNPGSNSYLTEGIPTAIRDGAWKGESNLINRSGREIPISQVILAHKAPDGKLEFLSTIMRDITESKRAEELLREREEMFRELFERIGDGLFRLALMGRS